MMTEGRETAADTLPHHGLAGETTLARLLELSGQALAALENGDLSAIYPILEARERLIAEVPQGGPPAGSAARKRDLLQLAEKLRRSDSRLALALADRRNEIGRHLAAMENGGAARSAYGPRGRARSTVNVVR